MSSWPRSDRAGVAAVALAAASWGTWSAVLRPTGLPGNVTGPVMFLAMGLFTLPFALRGPRARWDRGTIALLVGNAIFDVINVVTFFEALQRTTVAVAVLTHYLAPILVAVGAPRIEGTRVPGALAWAALATAGLTLVLEPWHTQGPVAVGAALGAISAVCYAGNVFVVRRLVPRLGAARTVSYHSLLGAALIAPFGLAGLHQVTASDLARLAIGSLVLGAIAGAVFLRGLDRIGSARAAVLTFAEPVVAVAVGWLVFDEPLGAIAGVGAVLILAAGIGTSRAHAA
ncbi:MAG: DMT family transporter [Deltaproteobacteria bacterium]|nr:DMT family transporter [Deltaproteobacteria bacterium]